MRRLGILLVCIGLFACQSKTSPSGPSAIKKTALSKRVTEGCYENLSTARYESWRIRIVNKNIHLTSMVNVNYALEADSSTRFGLPGNTQVVVGEGRIYIYDSDKDLRGMFLYIVVIN